MNKQTLRNTIFAFAVLIFASLVIESTLGVQASFNSPILTPTPFGSPLPTPPIPSPTPPPIPSEVAQIALAFLAEREGVAIENLSVVNELQRNSTLLGRTFQAVTVFDAQERRFFHVLVDLRSEVVEDVGVIEVAEEEAHQTRYGKLQPALYERLQTMRDSDTVTVMIWAAAGLGQSLPERELAAKAILAAKYPEAREAVKQNRKPMDVDDPELAEQIHQEYVELLETGMNERVQMLVTTLGRRGITVQTTEGFPAVTASMTKQDILFLQQQTSVGAIYLSEGQGVRFLETATATDRAPLVWARGYDGTGVRNAVLEDDNVDFTSPSGSACPASSNVFLVRAVLRRP